MKNILKYFLITIIIIICVDKSYAQKSEIVLQEGHKDRITSISLSADNKVILSSSSDGSIILWDLFTGKEIRKYLGHYSNSKINKVTFADNSSSALSGGDDQIIILWDLKTGEKIKEFHGNNRSIKELVVDPTNKYLVSLSEGDHVILWDIKKGRELMSLISDKADCFSFSHDGEILAIARDKKIYLENILTGEIIKTITEDCTNINELRYSQHGNFIISIDILGKIIVRNVKDYKITKTISGKYCALSANGQYMLVKNADKNNNYSIWDINLIEEKKNISMPNSNDGKISFYKSILSDDCKFLFTFENNNIIIWDLYSAKILKELSGHISGPLSGILTVALAKDNRYILAGTDSYSLKTIKGRTLKLWDLQYGKEVQFNNIITESIGSLVISPNNKYCIIGSNKDSSLNIWDIDSKKIIGNFISDQQKAICSMDISADCKYLAVSYEMSDNDLNKEKYSIIEIWNMENREKFVSFNTLKSSYRQIKFSPDGKYIAEGGFWGTNNEVNIWDIANNKKYKSFFRNRCQISIDYSPDGKRIVTGSGKLDYWSDNIISIYDIEQEKEIKQYRGHSDVITTVLFSPDSKYILSGSWDATIKYWNIDLDKNEPIKTFIGHNDRINSISTSKDFTKAISGSFDKSIRIWDIQNGVEIARIYSIDSNDYIFTTPDNYYTCSKHAFSGVSFRIDNKVFPFEQFDLQYNRPDIILERIGLAPSELIKSYREAYIKRLKKMNYDSTMFKEDYHLPEIKIVNKDELWGKETNLKNITLKIQAKDTAYSLDRINVFVNEVPIFGMNGMNLRNQDSIIYTANIPVELSDSINKIQVSVMNQVGVESIKDYFDITYNPSEKYKPKTYFVGIGVSNYKDTDFNLNYADKDIRNLDSVFQSKYSDNYVSITLLNEEVTKENILKIRETLLKTNVNDMVIVSISGHGMLNSKYDFYFATWDMNFQYPESRGLMFDDLDKLLDSIPARKKVLLIDACNSGEVDRDTTSNLTISFKNEPKKDITQKRPYPLMDIQTQSKLGLNNSFELMQEIFVNLSRGNGAVVISAAKGWQAAQESNIWNNGAFTYCIIEGLTKLEADKNGDKRITVSELKDYVITKVEEITNGSQKPTSRRENLAYDFVVW